MSAAEAAEVEEEASDCPPHVPVRPGFPDQPSFASSCGRSSRRRWTFFELPRPGAGGGSRAQSEDRLKTAA